eukprot:tig00020848_g14537.t1
MKKQTDAAESALSARAERKSPTKLSGDVNSQAEREETSSSGGREEMPGAPPARRGREGAFVAVDDLPTKTLTAVSDAPPCPHGSFCRKGNACKTVLCRHHFLDGSCKHRSEECFFAHSEEEQRPAAAFYKEKLRGCTRFYKEGFCVFGKNCIFWHTTAGANSSLKAAPRGTGSEPQRALSLASSELRGVLQLSVSSEAALLRALRTLEAAGGIAVQAVRSIATGLVPLGQQEDWHCALRLLAEALGTLRAVLAAGEAPEPAAASASLRAVEQAALAVAAGAPAVQPVHAALELLVRVSRGLQCALGVPEAPPPEPEAGAALITLYLVGNTSALDTLARSWRLRPLLDGARLGGVLIASGEGYRAQSVPGCEPGALARIGEALRQEPEEPPARLSDGRLPLDLRALAASHPGRALFALVSPTLALPAQERLFDAVLAASRGIGAACIVVGSPSGKGYSRPEVRTVSEEEFAALLADRRLAAQSAAEAEVALQQRLLAQLVLGGFSAAPRPATGGRGLPVAAFPSHPGQSPYSGGALAGPAQVAPSSRGPPYRTPIGLF